jgi:hypothetical protein
MQAHVGEHIFKFPLTLLTAAHVSDGSVFCFTLVACSVIGNWGVCVLGPLIHC